MSNRIQILLLDRKKEKSLTFPINPEQITIPHENHVSTYNLLNYGEVNVIGNRKAQTFTLSNFLPQKYSIWAELSYLIDKMKYKPYTQAEAIKLLEYWWNKKSIIRFIAGNINVECRISKYDLVQYERNADLGYSIELLEYRDPENDLSKKNKLTEINKETGVEDLTESDLPENNFGLAKQKAKFNIKLKERINSLPEIQKKVAQKGQTIYKIAKLYGYDFTTLAKLNKLENKLNTDIGGMIIEFPKILNS